MAVYRLALVLVSACLPLVLVSWRVFLTVAFGVVPLGALVATRALRLKRAPATNAEHFRSLVIAHRGGRAKGSVSALTGSTTPPPVFPENTLAAFRWSSSDACAADAIELDVWLSKDGVPVVHHDSDLFRLLGHTALVNDLTVAELQSLPFLARPNPSQLHEGADDIVDQEFVQSERIPTLASVMHFLATEAPHMKCMIEVKERARVREMAAALHYLYAENPWMYTRCFVASFNPILLHCLRRLDANVVTSFLFLDEWSSNLLRQARDNRIHIPAVLRLNLPLQWALDDLIWTLGTTRGGLALLGANLTACEVKAITEKQIIYERDNGTITTAWVANKEYQREWLLSSVITDLQFGGGRTSKLPKTPELF